MVVALGEVGDVWMQEDGREEEGAKDLFLDCAVVVVVVVEVRWALLLLGDEEASSAVKEEKKKMGKGSLL